MARDALERTVTVKVKRRWRKMTVRKAAYLHVAERAAAGDAKALDYLLSLESQERAPGSDQAGTQRSAAQDLAILQDFFDRRRASLPQHEHDDEPRGPGKREGGSK
jgi:DNA-binding LytR/AlgR family response regulator